MLSFNRNILLVESRSQGTHGRGFFRTHALLINYSCRQTRNLCAYLRCNQSVSLPLMVLQIVTVISQDCLKILISSCFIQNITNKAIGLGCFLAMLICRCFFCSTPSIKLFQLACQKQPCALHNQQVPMGIWSSQIVDHTEIHIHTFVILIRPSFNTDFEQRNSEAEFPDVEKTTTVTTSNTTNSGLLANVNDKDDASSFSSLLSIESVGLEHSLLQECISSAMPRPKVCGVLRKPQQMWSQLRGDFVVDDSLPEQDESHLSAALAPQPNGKEKESAAAVNTTAIKLGNKETALSAPVTQRASTLGSSDDSSLCSSTRPNSGPDYETHADEINSHCRVSNDDNQANKSRNTALHFLYCGSDGAHPRLPCSSNLATKSWTSPRLPPSVHQSHNHGVDVKGTVSASSEVNLSSGKFCKQRRRKLIFLDSMFLFFLFLVIMNTVPHFPDGPVINRNVKRPTS